MYTDVQFLKLKEVIESYGDNLSYAELMLAQEQHEVHMVFFTQSDYIHYWTVFPDGTTKKEDSL